MDDNQDIIPGRQREGLEQLSPSDLLQELTPRGKPPGRVDKMAASVIEVSYALRAIALSLDEGPLRTLALEAAARSKAYATAAIYNSSLSRGKRGKRADADDKRTMAIQARDRNPDPER